MRRPIRSPRPALFAVLTLALFPAWAALPLPAQEVTTFVEELPGSVGGVSVDALGFVYSADFGERVWKIDPSGEAAVFVSGLYGASGNTVDRRGRLLQAEFHADRVVRIDRTGEIEVIADEGLSGPVGLALGEMGDDGELFVCNCKSDEIARIDPDGSVSVVASGELFDCPNGILRTDDGTLYVVNFNGDHMVRIAPDGTVSSLAELPGGAGHLTRLGDTFFVTRFKGNRIVTVSAEGEVRELAGDGRPGGEDGPVAEATFTQPNGIAVDRAGMHLFVNELRRPFFDPAPKTHRVRRIRLRDRPWGWPPAPTEEGAEE